MYQTIFKLIWPYIVRYVAGYVADYLQNRREQRLAGTADQASAPETPPAPLAAAAVAVPSPSKLTGNQVWFTLAGLLLGSAIGMIAYLLAKDSRSQG